MSQINSFLALFLALIASWPTVVQGNCATTRIVLPLRTSMETLKDMLNRDIPNHMSGREDIDISGVKGEHVWWSMHRSEINLVADDNRLNANTTISGEVRVRGKVRPFGPDFSVGPDLSIGANLSLQPELYPDWRLRPNIQTSARVTSARIKIPAIGSISVRTQSQRAVDKLVRRMEDRINEKFGNNESLQGEGEKFWKELHRVEQLTDAPKTWLVVKPTRIATTNPGINDEGIDIKVLLEAETDVKVGNEPTLTPVEHPQLEIEDKLDDEGKTELTLPVFSDWETLNDLIGKNLPTNHKEASVSLDITKVKLLWSSNETVRVRATVSTATAKGWFSKILLFIEKVLQAMKLPFSVVDKSEKMDVTMLAEPYVSEKGTGVGLRNVELLPEESGSLVKTFDETIEKVVEKHAVADLSALLDEAEKNTQAMVNKFTEKLKGDGFSLDINLLPVTRLTSVSVHEEGLVAKFCAAAKADAEIRSINF